MGGKLTIDPSTVYRRGDEAIRGRLPELHLKPGRLQPFIQSNFWGMATRTRLPSFLQPVQECLGIVLLRVPLRQPSGR
ncbi:MAG: hypothetical protein QW225_01935 [Candidatus Jordarchaeales archaeon]